jgi:UDP-2,3-diacylglucosamine hydrolase
MNADSRGQGLSPPPEGAVFAPDCTDTGPVFFLADAHLGGESSSFEEQKELELLSLLHSLRGRASALYIVGDLFDFWFEYPTVTPTAHFEILMALSELSHAGTSIRFLGGNHDYWAGEKLQSITGASVFHTPVRATHFGQRLFIAHGDGLPAGDRAYRALKAVIRSRPAIAAFRLLRPRIGAALARWASGLSEISDSRIEKAIPPMKEFLESKLKEGYDAAVVAHVHRPQLWKYDTRTAVIVGDWMANRAVVELREDGFRLLKWSGESLVELAESPALGGTTPERTPAAALR